MTPPPELDGAPLEATIAGGVHLYDASGVLPTSGMVPKRPLSGIERVYVHHSGRLGRPGLAGLQASARYVVRERGWPCIPYHYWIPFEPILPDGQVVIFRGSRDEVRGYHTGGPANGHGLGVCLQGNATARELSQHQIDGLRNLLIWLRWTRHPERLDHPTWLSWHSESGRFGGSPKPACPGRHAEAWLRDYRERAQGTR